MESTFLLPFSSRSLCLRGTFFSPSLHQGLNSLVSVRTQANGSRPSQNTSCPKHSPQRPTAYMGAHHYPNSCRFLSTASLKPVQDFSHTPCFFLISQERQAVRPLLNLPGGDCLYLSATALSSRVPFPSSLPGQLTFLSIHTHVHNFSALGFGSYQSRSQ